MKSNFRPVRYRLTLCFGLMIFLRTAHPGLAGEWSLNDGQLEARRWVNAVFRGEKRWEAKESSLVVHANYGAVQKNGRGDDRLNISGQRFARGFYCHALSHITVRLPAPGAQLIAKIGIDSNNQTRPQRGSVVFVVQVDQQAVFRSPVVREGSAAEPVQVDLHGATEFEMIVEDGGDGISCDQADWAEAQVVLDNGRTLWLDELPMVCLQSGPWLGAPPFSFQYGGVSSGELLTKWKTEHNQQPLDDQRIQHVLAYRDTATGLLVQCVAIEYLDFPAVEWTVYFQNTGSNDTPILSDIRALDVTLTHPPGSDFVLHHHRGDMCTPDSFEPLETPLGPQAELRFAPHGGRPTNGQWPYYHVRWGQESLLAAVGWPGQWAAVFSRDAGEQLRIQAGQELTHFTLHPGEQVRTPLIVLQFWRGDRLDAHNAWRRWMLKYNTPQVDQAPPAPMLSSCSGGFFPGLKCNTTDELRFIDTLAREGIQLDYWWMDAGWYPCDAWPVTGTWKVDPTRFPDGIRAISDHAHAQGTKLILWFEPERVTPGTELYQEHPDWLLGQDGGTKLLDLGNPKARDWLTEHVDQLINEQGIDLYRQDFNLDPLPFWRAADTETRQGITEIRHVEGYLAYWDELRRRHPNMLIDSCASGGRRNDLETLRRAVPLLRSDYQSFGGELSYAAGNQAHTYGLAFWIPYFGTGVYYSNDSPLYGVRSYYCPAFGFCADVRLDNIDWDTFRKGVADWRKLAPAMLGDYYPLTPCSLGEDVWIAWQFHRRDTDDGVVQAYRRRNSIYESAQLCLRGLDPDARYVVTSCDEPLRVEATGRELADDGLSVKISQRPGAVILIYQRQP